MDLALYRNQLVVHTCREMRAEILKQMYNGPLIGHIGEDYIAVE